MRPLIEVAVNDGSLQAITQVLGLLGVINAHEGIVGHFKGNTGSGQLSGQPIMAIEVDLEAKRRPCGHADIAQTELLIDEVEVVMQALAGGGLEVGLSAGFVVPGTVGRTGLHGREHMHQAGVLTPLGEDLLDPRLLTKGLETTDELNLQSRLASQLFGIATQFISQRLGPMRVVEQTDAAVAEETFHSPGIGDLRQGTGDDDTVKTGQYTGDLMLMTLNKRIHRTSLLLPDAQSHLYFVRPHTVGVSSAVHPCKRMDARAGRMPKHTGGMLTGLHLSSSGKQDDRLHWFQQGNTPLLSVDRCFCRPYRGRLSECTVSSLTNTRDPLLVPATPG